MRELPTVLLGSCFAALASCFVALAGCQADPSLAVTAADPRNRIEARYTEDGRTVVFRARATNGSVVAEILDDRGHSLTSLATAVLNRQRIPIQGLVANASSLEAAVPLAARGLAQLPGALPGGGAGSALLEALSQQPRLLRRALGMARSSILHEWGNETRRRIPMSQEEGKKLFAILGRQARTVASGEAALDVSAMDGEISALLGADRYARYRAMRTSWVSSAGPAASAVLP